MYDGAGQEFVEFTNTGTVAVDMTGWSYADNSQTPGAVSLNGFGLVQAGESVILCENNATTFRTIWNLCSRVKVIGGSTVNLGRSDEINLYNASNTVVDRLTYGDQAYPGTIRTQNKSGWVNAAGVGTNTISNWTLSAVGDAEGSAASTLGDVGSPGKSTRATVAYTTCPPGVMRITEYMYDGAGQEFVEFTNTGTTAVNMTGYSYADNSRAPGAVSLSAFGTVQPGESVILAENNAATFRTIWGLCSGTKVIGGLTVNLGRSDEINLYNASNSLVDQLTYGDQAYPGTIRTQNKSGWVNAAGLGTNTISNWTLSATGDAEGSAASTLGDIGSPGKSTQALIAYIPCTGNAGAPVIAMNVTTTSNYIDGGATTAPASPFAISAARNDATDPVAATGIDFTISDDATPVNNLTVTVASSNQSVVPNANLALSGSGASRNLKITPAAVGYADITLTVNDGVNSTTYVLNYAASQPVTTGSLWPTGIADASAALALDDNYMVIANDESNILYVYDRRNSGLPAKTFDFNSGNLLGLTDGSTGNWKEVDVEAMAKSPSQANRSYWLGSMSNSSSFNDKPNRNRIFAIDITGTGTATSFTPAGNYAGLRSQLINWGDTHGYNFSASAADGKDPKLIDGFNAEGMVFGPDNTTLYIGFRAPLVPTGTRTKAVIAPVSNFETWFNNGAPAGNAVIAAPIELDLGGRGIRDMIRLSNGHYVIVAGSYDETAIPAIFKWSGNRADAPVLLPFNITGMNAEAVLPVNQGGQLALDQLQIISDNGDNIFYNDGVAAKDLPQDNFKKFSSSVIVSTGGNVLPVQFEYFIAQRSNNHVLLEWQTGHTDNAGSFELLRSTNGRDFITIGIVTAAPNQTAYTYTDVNPGNKRLYYRIAARDLTGRSYSSSIRIVNGEGLVKDIRVYPTVVQNGMFTINTGAKGNYQVTVYNSAGALYSRTRFTNPAIDMATTGWPAGVYWVTITDDNGLKHTEKIVLP